MPTNSGMKGFLNLMLIDSNGNPVLDSNGNPITKPNTPGDPDYVPPVYDPQDCPENCGAAGCGETIEPASGGDGTTITEHTAPNAGVYEIVYDTYTIEDRIDVYYFDPVTSNQVILATTGGFVGEQGTLSFNFDPATMGGTKFYVLVEGNPNGGTQWEYFVNCPEGSPTPTATQSSTSTETSTATPTDPPAEGMRIYIGQCYMSALVANSTTINEARQHECGGNQLGGTGLLCADESLNSEPIYVDSSFDPANAPGSGTPIFQNITMTTPSPLATGFYKLHDNSADYIIFVHNGEMCVFDCSGTSNLTTGGSPCGV